MTKLCDGIFKIIADCCVTTSYLFHSQVGSNPRHVLVVGNRQAADE